MADSPTQYRLAKVERCAFNHTACPSPLSIIRCDGCQGNATRGVLTDRVFVDPIERADVRKCIDRLRCNAGEDQEFGTVRILNLLLKDLGLPVDGLPTEAPDADRA